MLRLSGRLALGASALFLTCCGSPDPETTLGGATGGSVSAAGSGAGSGGAGGSAPAGGQGGSGGVSSSGAGGQTLSAAGAMACSNYTDQTGFTLPVHIKNVSATTLYLGQQESTCEAERLFQVQDGARQLLPSLEGCHTSCQALMQTGAATCPLACATPSTVTLGPGQSVDVPWDGRYAVTQALPQQCMPAASTSPASCVQAQHVTPAPFTFIARAGTHRQCLDPSGTCNCAPNANGTCTTPSSLISGTIITTQLLIKLEPGEVNPGGSPQYIGLEFKDSSN